MKKLNAYESLMRVLKTSDEFKYVDSLNICLLRDNLSARYFDGVVSCIVAMYKADRNFIRCSQLSYEWVAADSKRNELAMPGLKLHGCHLSFDIKGVREDRLSDAIYDAEYVAVGHDVLIDIINKLAIKTVGGK